MSANDNPYTLPQAILHWEDEQPRSETFDDVYFSHSDGLAETEAVFLQSNDLAQRFTELDGGTFCIAETGFGTGLNFLASWALWQDSRTNLPASEGRGKDQAKPARLHFVSVEQYPLSKKEISRALAAWPELSALSAQLIAQYPPRLPGVHRLQFQQNNGDLICLDLCFNDASAGFKDWLECDHPAIEPLNTPAVDAWFLDGFAPAKNSSMWSEALFQTMAKLSHPGSSFATFTAAGFVRRGLKASGFVVEKIPGHGSKREMLRGYFYGQADTAEEQDSNKASGKRAQNSWRDRLAWHSPSHARVNPNHQGMPRSALIIGAGLAGTSTAMALSQRGVAVSLIDAAEEVGSGASGNPQGILYTKLSPSPGALNWFTLHSFHQALRHYQQLPLNAEQASFCGVLQLANSEKALDHWQRLKSQLTPENKDWLDFVDADTASTLAGQPVEHPAVHYKTAGWLVPKAVCQAQWRQAQNRDALFIGGRKVASLKQTETQLGKHDTQQGQWQALDAEGKIIASADVAIIANSHSAEMLNPNASALPIKAIRGQLSYIPAEQHRGITPRCVICHEGYLAPPPPNRAEQLIIGASYGLRDDSCELRGSEHQHNWQQLQAALPRYAEKLAIGGKSDIEAWEGRASVRCASADYMPLVGAIAIESAFEQDFAALAKDASSAVSSHGKFYPGLYLNIAHGSRGLSSTPLCAELLAAQICGELPPLAAPLAQQLSPARFNLRRIIRGK